ncbi:MAG TPA: hypothetical protein GXX67_03885 [Petrimonas sp.]|jgi:hypothetical protein|nr:hypothetical protein [Petrimonas sp.]
MNKIFSIIVVAAVLLSVNACKQTNNKQTENRENTEVSINYLTVDEVFANGETLFDKTVHVEGLIEHVCKHSHKRFRIIGENENLFIKVELGNNLSTVDPSIVGQKAKVTGKLKPVIMDAEEVKEWEKKMRENHKGEEDTEHFKEEIAFIQDIYRQISSGKISYYTNYSIEAERYELE